MISHTKLGIPEYLALVKNLRGMVYTRREGGLLSWVRDRFKYRNLAIPASLKPFIEIKRPFVVVNYPFDSIFRLREVAMRALRAEPAFIDSLILASCFVTPLLIVGEDAADEAAKYSVSTVETRIDMKVRDWKLHLRIADYSVLDLYIWCTTHSKKLWEGYDLDKFVDERKKAIERDRKRYWRLERGKGKGRPFLAYFDLAQHLIESLGELSKLPKEEAVIALAIVPAIFVTEENIPR